MFTHKIPQISVLSGKGGTGKTTLTASFSALGPEKVIADCDVDAANLHIVLKAQDKETIDFPGAKVAVRDPEKCQKLGECERVCRFDAITVDSISHTKCEGCGMCVLACPNQALRLEPYVCGQYYVAETSYGPLVHAHLFAGAENSGRLVTQVRKKAEDIALADGAELILIDGPPGIGCTANAAMADVDLVLVVTEPTLSAVHDAHRLLELVGHFGIPAAVFINKWDINPAVTAQIEQMANYFRATIVGRMAYEEIVPHSIAEATPLVKYAPDSPAAKAICEAWARVLDLCGTAQRA